MSASRSRLFDAISAHLQELSEKCQQITAAIVQLLSTDVLRCNAKLEFELSRFVPTRRLETVFLSHVAKMKGHGWKE